MASCLVADGISGQTCVAHGRVPQPAFNRRIESDLARARSRAAPERRLSAGHAGEEPATALLTGQRLAQKVLVKKTPVHEGPGR